MLAVVAPGQGAQTPGFLAPWLEVPGVARALAGLSRAAGRDLAALGTAADADGLRDTAAAQPLLVGAGLAVLAGAGTAVAGLAGPAGAGAAPGGAGLVLAGHSVGEVTAAALAGVLGPADAMALVAARGAAMARAAAAAPTGMTAVLGGDPARVAEAAERLGLEVANVNGAGQLVLAGPAAALAALAADPPGRVRLVPLAVAGAFHTAHMAPAVPALAAAAARLGPGDPAAPLVSGVDGAVVAGGREAVDRLVAAVAAPVRWDAVQRTLARLGVTALVELPPAGTLAALARRALPGVEVLALRDPGDLPALADLVARHGPGRAGSGP